MLCQPDSGEMALEVVDQTVRSSAVDIICVDSVAALVPRAEIEGEMGAHQGDTDAHTPQHVIPVDVRATASLHAVEFTMTWSGCTHKSAGNCQRGCNVMHCCRQLILAMLSPADHMSPFSGG